MSLHKLVQQILFSEDRNIFWSAPSERNEKLSFVSEQMDNYQENRLDINRAVYLAASAIYRNAFETTPVNDDHPILKEVIRQYEAVIHDEVSAKYRHVLSNLPSVSGFEEWCLSIVESDRSNQDHPLFSFLQTEADLEQLKQFFLQESPFDMFFSDLISSMQVGHYGGEREEMLENFWDEMGHGDKQKFHRNMRVQMMEAFDIPRTYHLDNIENFDVSQLVLANYYLITVHSRRGQLELIGMMLATECMVPGRLEKQIAGWLRNGASKDDIKYLIEHVHVDEEHAEGWMKHVVVPLVEKNPEHIPNIVLGILMRLDAATEVCESMYSYLRQ